MKAQTILIAVYCLIGSSFLGSIQAHDQADATAYDDLRHDLFDSSIRMLPDQVAELIGEIFRLISENYYGQEIPHVYEDEIVQISDLYDLTKIHGQNCKDSNYFAMAKAQKEVYQFNSNIVGFIEEYRQRQLDRCLKDQPDFVPIEEYYY